MRIFLLLFFTTFASGQALADCASNRLWVYPKRGTIKQNSNIILTGYARSQTIVKTLNQDYPIYLESKGHKVKLVVKKIYEGQFSLTQAILEPAKKLKPGRTYQLIIQNLEEYERVILERMYSDPSKSEPISWTVESTTDNTIPKLLNTPHLVDKRVAHYGCGPAVYADFKINAEDDSHIFVKTELVALESGESTTYVLSLGQADTLNIGHSMCSGAFSFRNKEKYKIRFRLLDICGNESDQWTEWIEFNSPFDEN